MKRPTGSWKRLLCLCGLMLACASHAAETQASDQRGPEIAVEALEEHPGGETNMRRKNGDKPTILSNVGVGNPVRNSCSEIDLSVLDPGRVCGSPLGEPCFDHSRCKPVSEGGPGATIYVYDHDCTLKNSSELEFADEAIEDGHFLSPIWRKAARELGVLAETYESACAFIEVNMRRPHDAPCSTSAPLWNEGKNHMILDFTDSSRETRPTVAKSFAMEGASNIRTCMYRTGYDMAVPLSPEHLFPQFVDTPAPERKYFLTLKASVYLGGAGSEERMSLVPIHDPADGVVTSMHCFEYGPHLPHWMYSVVLTWQHQKADRHSISTRQGHQRRVIRHICKRDEPNRMRIWHKTQVHQEHLLPENVDYCQALKARYNDYNYKDLMNTTFGLVPGGRSQGTYRLAEVMSAGAIPVFIGRDIVRPFREQIPWPLFSFIFTPDEAETVMLPTLKAVSPESLEKMQRDTRQAYMEIYGDNPGHGQTRAYAHISRNVIRELISRIGHQ